MKATLDKIRECANELVKEHHLHHANILLSIVAILQHRDEVDQLETQILEDLRSKQAARSR
jgi:hypothetical protein